MRFWLARRPPPSRGMSERPGGSPARFPPPASLQWPRPLGCGRRPRCAGEGCGRLAEAEGRHARILITTSTGACQGPAAPANHRVRGAGGEGAGSLSSQWELLGRRGGGARAAWGPSCPSPPALLTSTCGARGFGSTCGSWRPLPPPQPARCAKPEPSAPGLGRGAGRPRAATKGLVGARRPRRLRSGWRTEAAPPRGWAQTPPAAWAVRVGAPVTPSLRPEFRRVFSPHRTSLGLPSSWHGVCRWGWEATPDVPSVPDPARSLGARGCRLYPALRKKRGHRRGCLGERLGGARFF